MHLIESHKKKYNELLKNSSNNGDFTRKISFISERNVVEKLLDLKFQIYLPEFKSSKADIICCRDNKLFKIQVKTAYYDKKGDAFNSKLAFRDFNPYKKGISKTVRYKKSDVDYFIVCLSMLKIFYVIPINVALDHSTSCFFYPHRDRKLIQNKGTSIETAKYLNAFNIIK